MHTLPILVKIKPVTAFYELFDRENVLEWKFLKSRIPGSYIIAWWIFVESGRSRPVLRNIFLTKSENVLTPKKKNGKSSTNMIKYECVAISY